MSDITPERRMTPTERLHEVTMAAMLRRPSEPESSVAISRNAKGVAQFEVVVRAASAADCLAEAMVIYDGLASMYPYPFSEAE